MLTLKFTLKVTTKTCYRFEHKLDDGQIMTLYLKKDQVDNDGIDAKNGILVSVEENKEK